MHIMHFKQFSLSALGLQVASFLTLGVPCNENGDVDAYVARMSPIAKAHILANVGPSGSKSSGAKAGVVIASPSVRHMFRHRFLSILMCLSASLPDIRPELPLYMDS